MQSLRPQSTGSDDSTTVSEASVADAPDVGSAFMINELTEDAVNTAYLGFDHQSIQSKFSDTKRHDHFATLILNIENILDPSWRLHIASGSWKRICINLVSNALKYTPSGYISVTLRKKMLQRTPTDEPNVLVELVVCCSNNGSLTNVTDQCSSG